MRTIRGTLAILVLLAVAIRASAEEPANEPLGNRAVCRIEGCSGICVDARGIVLTAKHCRHKQTARIEFHRGNVVTGERVYVSPEPEGPVAFVLPRDATYPAVGVSDAEPRVGDNVYSMGYPDGQFRVWRARVNGSVNTGFFGGGVLLNNTDKPAIPGHSGGPLFSLDGKLIGLLSTTSPNDSQWISWTAVTEAVRQAEQHVGQAPGSPSLQAPIPSEPQSLRTMYMFSATWCSKCVQPMAELTASPPTGIRFVRVEEGTPEFAAAERKFQSATGKRLTGYPTFWVEGSARYQTGYVGRTGLCDWVRLTLRLPLTVVDELFGVEAQCPGGFCPRPSPYIQPDPSPPIPEEPDEPPLSPVPDAPPAASPELSEALMQISQLSQTVIALQQRVMTVEQRPAIPGPPGAPGKDGAQGPPGAPATVDMTAIQQRVELLEGGWVYEVIETDGSKKLKRVKPGDTLTIRHKGVSVIGAGDAGTE